MSLAPPKGVHVESAWVRAAPPGAMMLAGYMTLRNDGTMPQRFVSAECNAFGMVELHKSVIVNGVSTMRAAGGQVIPAGGALPIAPGGFHLMLMEPKRALKIGDTVRFRLHFAGGTALDVIAPVSAEAPVASTR
jgi:copper(I)-binding protein